MATLLNTLSGPSADIVNRKPILAFPINLSIDYHPIAGNTAGLEVN